MPRSELHGPLTNCYKIKLRKSGYRLIYKVEDERVVVIVIDEVYRLAAKRPR